MTYLHLREINDIFTLKGIFVLSHLQFDGVRAQTDESGMEGMKKLEQWTFSEAHRALRSFLMAREEFP